MDLYSRINYPRNVVVTLGISAESVDDPTISRDRLSQLNPKAGVTWNATRNTTLRAAVTRVLKRTFISSQTLEPTNVSGFNQFFDDINGTDAWRWGVGIDYKLSDQVFIGAELSQRELDVPVTITEAPPRTVGRDTDETFARTYLYWTPSDWLTLSSEYRFDHIESDPEASPVALGESTIHRVPLEARLFHPSGLFARARATYVDQDGRFQDLLTGELVSGSDDFWAVDAGIGYRFPNQHGFATLEVLNLLDERFRFQDVDPSDPTIGHERTILGRLTLRF